MHGHVTPSFTIVTVKIDGSFALSFPAAKAKKETQVLEGLWHPERENLRHITPNSSLRRISPDGLVKRQSSQRQSHTTS